MRGGCVQQDAGTLIIESSMVVGKWVVGRCDTKDISFDQSHGEGPSPQPMNTRHVHDLENDTKYGYTKFALGPD